MIRAAVAVAPKSLLLVGVTVLTSANSATLREIGMVDDLSRQVVRLAKIGGDFGIGGVVASAHEIEALRKAIGQKLRLIIPGIRPRGSDDHDQKRTMTPAEAITGGADFLVIDGRSSQPPIRQLQRWRFLKKSKAVFATLTVIDDPVPRSGPLNMAIDEVLLGKHDPRPCDFIVGMRRGPPSAISSNLLRRMRLPATGRQFGVGQVAGSSRTDMI